MNSSLARRTSQGRGTCATLVKGGASITVPGTVKLPVNEETILYQTLIYYKLKKRHKGEVHCIPATEVTCWQEII